MQGTEIKYIDSFNEDDITQCVKSWQEKYDDISVFALVAESEKHNISVVQKVSNNLKIQLIGAIFPSLIVENTFKNKGILLFCHKGDTPYLLRDELTHDNKNALKSEVINLAEEVLSLKKPGIKKPTLFLIFDAMVPDIATILRYLYLDLSDRYEYTGINAGSETFTPMKCLFDNNNLIENGFLAMILDEETTSVVDHGYLMPKEKTTATTTTNNCIHTIDNRPAFDVYKELIKSQYGVDVTKENFYEYGVHFPFGIIHGTGELLVRIPVALTDEGYLFCVGEVPVNSHLALLSGPEDALMKTVNQIGIKAKENNVEKALTFYCAGRRLHLGIEQAERELNILSESIRPTYGALSLGEIRTEPETGYPRFHNGALVVIDIK